MYFYRARHIAATRVGCLRLNDAAGLAETYQELSEIVSRLESTT